MTLIEVVRGQMLPAPVGVGNKYRIDVGFRRKSWPTEYALTLVVTAFGLAFMMDWGEGDDEERYNTIVRPDDVVADDWETVEC